MLSVCVSGSASFKNQIKNRIQPLFEEGYFDYREDPSCSHIIISEEENIKYEPSLYPEMYVFIEVLRGRDGRLSAAQNIAGKKTDCFELKDILSVLQGECLMIEILRERDRAISDLKKNALLWEDEQTTLVQNFENARDVQRAVMDKALNLKMFDVDMTYIPKSIISGDFVVAKEIFGKLFVFFGDVTDHGVYAGEYAASLVALASSYLDECSMYTADLQNFVSYMARAAFYYHGESEQSSCECVLCEINPAEKRASFCTFGGGTTSPIVIKPDGTVKRVFDTDDLEKIKPRLGDSCYEGGVEFKDLPGTVSVRFHPGDAVLFYTDGFSEMFSLKGTVKDQQYIYGVENMVSAATDACEKNGNFPSSIIRSVIRDISSYGVAGLEDSSKIENMVGDDATMYCVRLKVPSEVTER